MAIDVQIDVAEVATVIDSLVTRGDISALNPQEKARYYIAFCNALKLNPASKPLDILRLNGKEVLYPTRGATDQLAAIHRLNREIIDGPKVIDLAGTKLVYAMCRAMHPNGRTETAVATVPLSDPANVLMKCETKAKRRATLSILGLGMLDETEVESIPASAKSAAPPIDLGVLEHVPQALAELTDDLASAETLDAVATVWLERSSDLAEADTTADGESRGLLQQARRALSDRLVQLGLARSRTEADALLKRRCHELAQAKQAPAPVAVEEAPVASPALPAAYLEALRAATSPEECVEVYRQHAPGIVYDADRNRTALYTPALEAVCAACIRTGLDKSENVLEYVKDRIARGAPKGDGPKGGKRSKPTAAPASAQGSSAETTQGNGAQASVSYLVPLTESARFVASADEWAAHCAAYKHREHAVNSWAKHCAAFRAAGEAIYRARLQTAAERLQALVSALDAEVCKVALLNAERTAAANARRHAEHAVRKAG